MNNNFKLMGILNVTPDSFSDGGYYTDEKKAVQRAVQMLEQGANILDIGAESTRPGAKRVPAWEQIRRLSCLEKICAVCHGVPLSIDTTHSKVAAFAIDHGCSIINDIAAGREDPHILPLAAERGTSICLMHMHGEPQTMQNNPQYRDVVTEVRDFLASRAEAALAAGIAEDKIILDPGIGFGKTVDHNLTLLRNLSSIVDLGFTSILGCSRKHFIASSNPSHHILPPSCRVTASCVTTVIGIQAGVDIFRVHDIAEHLQAAQLTALLCN